MGQKNIFGSTLETCNNNPRTGFTRNGCCDSHPMDYGNHTVCAVMTDEFLNFSKTMGNDLSTPRPEFGFPGLRAGDRWCLCLPRWLEAREADAAPEIIPEACNEEVLNHISIKDLIEHAHQKK